MKCPSCGFEKCIFLNTQEMSEFVEFHMYYCKNCKNYFPSIIARFPSNIPQEERKKVVDELKKKIQSEGGYVIEK